MFPDLKLPMVWNVSREATRPLDPFSLAQHYPFMHLNGRGVVGPDTFSLIIGSWKLMYHRVVNSACFPPDPHTGLHPLGIDTPVLKST